MEFLKTLHIESSNKGSSTGSVWLDSGGTVIKSYSPVNGKEIGQLTSTDRSTYDLVIRQAGQAFLSWRQWPAPKRGEIVRQIGESLRDKKEALGRLVSYEMGKSLQEGFGEV